MKYIDAEKLVAEIERLKKLLEGSTYYLDNSQQALGYSFALDDFDEFLDTLPDQEHPIYELNQILLDWAREANTDKEQEARFEAYKRFFELYDEYMVQDPEQPVEGLDVTDFCKPVDPGIAKCVADHWWELLDDENAADKKAVKEIVKTVHKEVTRQVKEMVKEQPEELEEEMDEIWLEFCEDVDYLVYASIARHFAEFGRKQVLQEIYDGKVKPVDKITAAWLDDEQNT